MITPKFSLSQDDCYLFIEIYAPHIKKDEAEIDIEEDQIYFYCKPYFLRLHLPGNIVEDDRSKSSYNADSGWLSLRLAKEKNGEHFENLHMLTKLLTPKRPQPFPSVEVLSSDQNQKKGETHEKEKETTSEDKETFEPDWFIEQSPYQDEVSNLLNSEEFAYGFALQKTNPLNELMKEYPDMIDLPNPDSVPLKQRGILRYNQEQESFDCEHYLADIYDNETLSDIIKMEFPSLTGTKEENSVLTEKEQEQLLQLPRREYLIDDDKSKFVFLGIYDLIFAYAFDFRQTLGEHCVESDWTICKLSSYLSWLDTFTDLESVVITSARRCLSFPLYRNMKMFKKVFSDVKLIIKAGKIQILKCLLSMKMIIERSESKSPLANIFLTDYCVWIQSACPKKILSLSNALEELTVTKDLLDLQLQEIEADGEKLIKLCENDSSDSDSNLDKLSSAVSNVVKIQNEDDDDDSDDESDSSSDECYKSNSSTDESESDASSVKSNSDISRTVPGHTRSPINSC